MVGSKNIWEISEGIFFMCREKAFGNASVSISVVTISNGSNVVGDMEEEESGEVAVEEDSTIIMGPASGEEARWTKMSTIGGDVATMA